MKRLTFLALALIYGACHAPPKFDYIIENGAVFTGEDTPVQSLMIGLRDDRIAYVGEANHQFKASIRIDASGLYVLPGFIDPHTHSMSELSNDDGLKRRNLNYQFQGVTTVVNGNDGFGDPDIQNQSDALEMLGIGTNTAFFIGHGALRQKVMGGEKRAPTLAEMSDMKDLVAAGMEAGALGLSTGLFYAPGSFSDTDEVIEIAKVAAKYGGIYDSHIRDESTYNIGLIAAVDEVIEIAREADIAANIAHIKALGVDVWGDSETIIRNVEAAHAEGLKITADQYPWRASGTRISNALIPRWVKAGTSADYLARLNDESLTQRIRTETAENLRKRGGPKAVLITASLSNNHTSWNNKTLQQLSDEAGLAPVDVAIEIARQGDARIASFNMSPQDIEAFMVQDWVMTSSDGSTGHPRKYASYPKKYQTYVKEGKKLTVETFIHRSTGLVADTFNLCDRGYLRKGFFADIAILDPENFKPVADFQTPDKLSEGVVHLFVNGTPTIENGRETDQLPGQIVKRCNRK